MNRLARSLAVAATAGSLTLLAAPASPAATSTATASSCATLTVANKFGDGRFTVCPIGGTSYQLSGYIETSMPFNFLDNPQCYTFYLYAGSTFLGDGGTDVCVTDTAATSKTTFNYARTFSAMPTSATFVRDWI
ncbi:hypothetical protein ABT095_29610 [Kitasatospora sp. NPDC002227]|uniref:hypothetical protein n=1 Tax=Kitasatospora sp. NPDC002227 TaxID=3154773 RepID=UPI00332727F9